MPLLSKILQRVTFSNKSDRLAKLYRDLIRHEAKIGGQVFGEAPDGVRREFVCLDKHTWLWHEEWVDENNERQVRTTRYDVRPDGVIKSQNGTYHQVGEREARRLVDAAHEYYRRIKKDIYNFV